MLQTRFIKCTCFRNVACTRGDRRYDDSLRISIVQTNVSSNAKDVIASVRRTYSIHTRHLQQSLGTEDRALWVSCPLEVRSRTTFSPNTIETHFVMSAAEKDVSKASVTARACTITEGWNTRCGTGEFLD